MDTGSKKANRSDCSLAVIRLMLKTALSVPPGTSRGARRFGLRSPDLHYTLASLLIWITISPGLARAQSFLNGLQLTYSGNAQPFATDNLLLHSNWAESPTQIATGQAQTNGKTTDLKAEEKQRFLGVVPARSVVISGQAPPLATSQKFSLYLHSTIDPFTFFAAGVVGGVEQAENTYPAYGQGAAGFGKRFGSAYADSVDSHLWGKAILPSIFHQDPRYFRRGNGSGGKRLLYGVAAVVRCKGDDGHWQFAFSNIAGNFIGGAVSNAYFPSQDRGGRLVWNRGLVVTAEGAVGYILSEFYPDIAARLHHKRQQ